ARGRSRAARSRGLETPADARQPDEFRMRARPLVHDARQLFVAQVAAAEVAHLASDSRPMMPSVRKAIASPAIRPPPISDMLSMSAGASSLLRSRRCVAQLQREEKMPPTPYQSAVGNSTKT